MTKTPTAAEIETALRERIEHAEYLVQLGDIVRETARKMLGRKVDKRFGSAVQARVTELMGEGWTVSYDKDDWRTRLSLWTGPNRPNAPQWRDRADFTIARHGEHMRDPIDTVSEVWIVAENPAYFAEAERLPRLREALDTGKAAEWAAQAAELAARRAALFEDMQAHEAGYLVKID
jgi:hypothetical protein